MANNFAALEQQHGLPMGLLSAVMSQESGGNPNAVSPAGAQGPFQFMPATAQQYGVSNPYDINQAAPAAAQMYGDLLQKYNGDLPSALAGYNWGQGNVDRKGLQNAPAETRNYINNIQNKMGTQYAQNIDPSKLSDADLDMHIAQLQSSQQIDPTKLSNADLDAQIARLQGSNPGMAGVPNVPQAPAQDLMVNENSATPSGPIIRPDFNGVKQTFNQGVQSFADIPNSVTDNTASLPARNALVAAIQSGTATRADYENAFLEGYSNNPIMKAIGGAAGTVGALPTTVINSAIPPIANAAGINPQDIQTAMSLLPAAKGIGEVGGMVADASRTAPAFDPLAQFKANLPQNTQISALGEHPSMMPSNSDATPLAATIPTADPNNTNTLGANAPAALNNAADPILQAKAGILSKNPNPLDVGLEANQGISKAYGEAQAKVNASENSLRQNNIQIQGGDFIPHIDNLVNYLSDKILPDSGDSLALKQLQKIRDGIDGSSVDSNDLLDIRQAINSIVGDGKFLKSGDKTLLNAKTYVDNVLQRGSQENPAFAKILSKYKTDAQDIASRFTNNSALKPFWQPEDAIAYKASKNPNNINQPGYSDSTLSRANAFLDNLNRKNKAGGVLAVSKALPKDHATAVIKAAVIRANKANPNPFISIAKDIATAPIHPIGSLRGVVSTLANKPKTVPINELMRNLKKMGNK